MTHRRQCVLAGVSRATVQAQRKRRPMNQTDVLLKHLMDKEYTHRPFYGSRKVNRKPAQRLMCPK